MKNENDKSAKYYDLAFLGQKSEYETSLELELIKSLVDSNAKILDVGCGTGRHLLPLANSGFELTGIEPSKGMLMQLKAKLKSLKVNLINKELYKANFESKYDLAILMWNTFNEMCLTKKDALQTIQYLQKNLAINGKILINIDDPLTIDPSSFDFIDTHTQDNLEIQMLWKTYKYYKTTNTSISREYVKVTNTKTGKVEFESTAFIKQRYWSLEEIVNIAKNVRLKLELKKIKGSSELYILLSS